MPPLPPEFPRSAVCRVEVVFPKGFREEATGWALDRRSIILAAHSLFKRTKKETEKAVSVEGWMGQHTNAIDDEFQSTEIVVAPRWGNGADKSWDVAVVRLAAPLSTRCVTLDLATEPLPPGATATVVGYPENRTILEGFSELQFRIAAGRLEYVAPTSPGMSGGPVVIRQNGALRVIGVHTHGSTALARAMFFDRTRAAWVRAPSRQDIA